MARDLEGRVAVVTGASRGLGRSIAVELARRGAFVVINFRSPSSVPEVDKTLALMAAAGGQGRGYQTDVSKPDQVQAMFKELYKDHKKIDILINNAGITRDEYFLMMRPQDWDDLLATNLNAVFYCSKAVIRNMCATKRGVIINIGSGSALVAMPGQVNYSATKAGLLGFSRSLAREVADKNVRVLVVAPGFTESEMSGAIPTQAAEASVRMIPLQRWGRPEELARVVGFFASDDASYITGQTIIVDGGRQAIEQDFGF